MLRRNVPPSRMPGNYDQLFKIQQQQQQQQQGTSVSQASGNANDDAPHGRTDIVKPLTSQLHSNGFSGGVSIATAAGCHRPHAVAQDVSASPHSAADTGSTKANGSTHWTDHQASGEGGSTGVHAAQDGMETAQRTVQAYSNGAATAPGTLTQPGAAPQAESARTALPRTVLLTDAVKKFLAKPVSGPHRPIFFDLETTGDTLVVCL